MSDLVLERCATTGQQISYGKMETFGGRTYECRVLLCPEPCGGFSAHAIRLPGVVSEGETVAEALDNVADAFQAAVQEYLAEGTAIPWENAEVERPSGSMERWVLVNV